MELGHEAASPRGARVVGLRPEGSILPRSCPCCGAVGAHGAVVARADGAEIIVNLCEPCLAHAGSFGTQRLSAAIASLVFGLALSAALPVLAPWLPFAACLPIVLGGAALPLLVGRVLRRRLRSPHSARGNGVWWRDRELHACNDEWAAELARLNGAELEPGRSREPWFSAWMSSGLVVGAGSLALFHWLHHPLLRIVNVTEARVEVTLDGRPLAVVEPTSGESPTAGVELRVPSGSHEISVRSLADGRLVSRKPVYFEGGRAHLFAPGSEGYCFWLESTGYGRAGGSSSEYEPLPGDEDFWVLPRDVDTWFSPNPPPGEGRSRASGGVLTALRQAPCAEAPRHE